ncbi:MAG: helix-turn-helix domain-containing protein [Spartobacteria bacterium]|nr:helix-turn-helix domain-containing protein [Spartobacteria bacterium]
MHNILTLEEVAEYLRVSERTIYDWVQKGELPGGKLGNTWRFKRDEIEKWVDEKLAGPGGGAVSATVAVTTSAVLTVERVVVLDSGEKIGILTKLVDILSETPFVHSRDDLLRGILAREDLMSTGIGCGIGVPHVRLDSISDLVMAVAVCRSPIEGYVSLDGAPVHIVCMLAAHSDQHTKYIRTLSAISSCLKDPLTRERIINADDPDYIYSLLTTRS